MCEEVAKASSEKESKPSSQQWGPLKVLLTLWHTWSHQRSLHTHAHTHTHSQTSYGQTLLRRSLFRNSLSSPELLTQLGSIQMPYTHLPGLKSCPRSFLIKAHTWTHTQSSTCKYALQMMLKHLPLCPPAWQVQLSSCFTVKRSSFTSQTCDFLSRNLKTKIIDFSIYFFFFFLQKVGIFFFICHKISFVNF